MATVTGWPRDGYSFHADELGDTFAGLIRRDSAGLPVPGVLGDLTVAAVASSWQVSVSPFVFVERVGTGVRFSGESAASHVDITPAAGSVPAGQARIDVVAWDTDAAELVVVEGTPAASPVAPSAGGAEPLARVRVNAGDGQTVSGQITEVFERTGLVGGRMDQGKVASRSVASNGFVDVPVVFESGMFTSAPVVIPGVVSGGSVRAVSAFAMNVTATGFTMRLDSSSTMTRNFGAHWRAEQL